MIYVSPDVELMLQMILEDLEKIRIYDKFNTYHKRFRI